MECSVYKSSRKDELYVYLRSKDDFSVIPAELLSSIGAPIHVIDLELTAKRRLAREDVTLVLQNLAEKGFHIQLPPIAVPIPSDDRMN